MEESRTGTGIDNSKRVAIVIGSGSVKCAAALGVQQVFNREGIEVDMVVGCSAGSFYATLMAAGLDVETVIDMSQKLWTRELTSQKNRRAMLAAVMPKLFGFTSRWGLRDHAPIMRRLHQVFGPLSFESMKIPLYLTATDFETGEQAVFSSGNLVDAIRASIAIPFILEPWPVGDRLFIDGFMSDPLPVGVAMREGAHVIVAVGFESPMQTRIDSVARFSFQLSSIMTNNLLRSSFAFHNLAHHAEVIPIIPVFRERIRLFDTAKIPYIVEEGARCAEEQLPYLRRLLAAAGGEA